ncbi:MAG: dihydroorotate dehydrogenase [Hyphomicrobiales bacterium]|nr:MAG: dihydroorotate dehydrogenase [Hyphomicrobiales bacterium]
MPQQLIYKISSKQAWKHAQEKGVFKGAEIDLKDGFIHFSNAAQVAETAAKHFNGQADLILAAIDANALGDALKYEISRGNDLFPHLYADLSMDAVVWTKELPLGENGAPRVPTLDGGNG